MTRDEDDTERGDNAGGYVMPEWLKAKVNAAPEVLADLQKRRAFDPQESIRSAIAALDSYVAREGHARVPTAHLEGGFYLGQWVSDRRAEYKTGSLDSSLSDQLGIYLGWSWSPLDDDYRAGLAALDRFIAREGHSNVPIDHKEQGLRLGRWVGTRRYNFTKGIMSQQQIIELDARTAWAWTSSEAVDKVAYAALAQFIAMEGHARVPATFTQDGFRLGSWVSVKRKEHRQGRLPASEAADLAAFDGWTWDPHQSRHTEALRVLGFYIEREGNSRVPASHIESGFTLGSWVASRRSDHRSGSLSDGLREALGQVTAWEWEPKLSTFEDGLAELDSYISRTGDTRVPYRHVENGFGLGLWAAARRSENESGRLDAEHRISLESRSEWSWASSLDWNFEDGLLALDSYIASHGNSRVPPGHIEGGVSLGKWVRNQRRTYRHGRLPSKNIQRLAARSGWVWSQPDADFKTAIAALDDFVARTGEASVPGAHVESGVRLGAWVSSRRAEFHKGLLSGERIQILESYPDWTWTKAADTRKEALRFLSVFVQREGHSRVPATHRESGFTLGRWVYYTRRRFDLLSTEQRVELEAYPGWFWVPSM